MVLRIQLALADQAATIENCASALSLSLQHPFSRILRGFPHLDFLLAASRFSLSLPGTKKEVINIATAFRSWPSKGTKLCPRMGGVTPNPQSQNGSLWRPPASFGGTMEVSSQQLQVRPDRGWLRTIFSLSRNVLPNGEDTANFGSPATLARRVARSWGCARVREDSRGARRSLTLRIFPRRLRRVREILRGPSLFFSTIARVRVRANISTTRYTRTEILCPVMAFDFRPLDGNGSA